MISTGREYDRFVIGMLIITVAFLAVYTVYHNKQCSIQAARELEQTNINFSLLSAQIKDTRHEINDWTKSTHDVKNALLANQESEPANRVPVAVSSNLLDH